MKERIRELADEADKWSQTMTWSSDPKYGDRPVSDLFNEKFAELIVRECAGVVEDAVDHREPASTYVGKIKQHFGVEE
jgi:hypothetical protein